MANVKTTIATIATLATKSEVVKIYEEEMKSEYPRTGVTDACAKKYFEISMKNWGMQDNMRPSTEEEIAAEEAVMRQYGILPYDNTKENNMNVLPEDEDTEKMEKPRLIKKQAKRVHNKGEFIALTGAELQQGSFLALDVFFIENNRGRGQQIHWSFPYSVYQNKKNKCQEYIAQMLQGLRQYGNVVTKAINSPGGQAYYRTYIN